LRGGLADSRSSHGSANGNVRRSSRRFPTPTCLRRGGECRVSSMMPTVLSSSRVSTTQATAASAILGPRGQDVSHVGWIDQKTGGFQAGSPRITGTVLPPNHRLAGQRQIRAVQLSWTPSQSNSRQPARYASAGVGDSRARPPRCFVASRRSALRLAPPARLSPKVSDQDADFLDRGRLCEIVRSSRRDRTRGSGRVSMQRGRGRVITLSQLLLRL